MTEETPSEQPNLPKKKIKIDLRADAGSAPKDPSSMISTYKKRQQIGPFVIWGLVVLLLVSGIILLIVWLASGNGPKISLFATETPTPTITPSPTATNTLTPTATETVTPSPTLSPTPSAPFEYTIQENDNLWGIADKFALGDKGLEKLYALNPEIDPLTNSMSIGQKILIPHPGYQLPTATPLPTGLAKGTKLDYVVKAGDTIAGIASLFNSTAEDILKENDITDANTIYVGQLLIVRANLATPTSLPNPTITPGPSPTPPSPFTPTPPGGVAPSPTVAATPTK